MPQKPDERFKDAFAKRKKAEEEKKERRNGNFPTVQFEDVKSCAPIAGEQRAFRLLGNDPSLREKPTDPKVVKFSRWIADKGKNYTNIIWKTDYEGKLDDSWLLTEFYNDVMDRSWVNYTEEDKANNPKIKDKKGYYKYHNEDSPTFQRIFNNTRRGDLYPPKAFPKDLIIQNCIDRNDDWCQTHKHSKLFTKRLDMWPDKNTGQMIETAKEPGYSASLLLDISNLLARSPIFDWRFVDIVIEKTDSQSKYDVKSACSVEISDEMKRIASKEPLTSEEEKYELYDLDKLFPVTSYNKLKRNFLNLFKMWDAETGKKYTERLEALAEEERKEREAQGNSVDDEDTDEQNDEVTTENETPSTNPVHNAYYNEVVKNQGSQPQTERVVERQPASTTKITKQDIFPYYDRLSEADKVTLDKNLVNIDDVNKKVVWTGNAPACDINCMFPKLDIRSTCPIDMSQCPVCGKKFGNN